MLDPAPPQPQPLETSLAPLGAQPLDGATRFAAWSAHAAAVEVCLLDSVGAITPVPLQRGPDGLWDATIAGVGPGQRYALRAYGPWAPALGHRFDPTRLLLDPWATAIDGDAAVVMAPPPDSPRPARPGTPWADTVIYELHVKGFTRLHPAVEPHLQGTYAGLAHPAVIEHLRGLGVTAVELLPVQEFRTEPALLSRGAVNYWGYSPIGYFAPHGPYAASGPGIAAVHEFRAMVDALHAAGIEVLIDVVYNHTAEGGPDDPALSFRGLDNAAYYRLQPGDLAAYDDVTGCGNTLDAGHPIVVRLITESLRWWVEVMGVDGFRFDLAPATARTEHGFAADAPLLRAIRCDPLLSQVKLIAEPWDLGLGGYRLGGFPPPWSEWNAFYRDSVRDFWRGAPTGLADLTRSLAGSSDVFLGSGRGPSASINFITAHDGFTLRDLVTYNDKHNEANGETNHDGHDDNRSWNGGVEGPTDDPVVLALRERRLRGLLATLAVSCGVPMLSQGDERGRSQWGNNNAYCQDNALAWVDWTATPAAIALETFTRRLLALRRAFAVLRRDRYFSGRDGDGPADVLWLQPDGAEMGWESWHAAGRVAMAVLLDGRALEPEAESLLILLNGGPAAASFALPDWAAPRGFEPLIDTSLPSGIPEPGTILLTGAAVQAWSVVLLHARR